MAVAFATLSYGGLSAHAQDASTRGVELLASARNAWAQGSLEEAEALFRNALEAGHLTPSEVVEATIYVATVEVAAGKVAPARDHFRLAALIDPAYSLPLEASKAAIAMATAEKKKAVPARFERAIRAPASVTLPGTITLEIPVSNDHATHVTSLWARAEVGKREVTRTQVPTESVTKIDLRIKEKLQAENVIVRVAGVDAHENHLVERDITIRISHSAGAVPVVVATGPKKSIWATPWPYLLGGVLFIGGGTALVIATRHDTVNTLPVRVEVTP